MILIAFVGMRRRSKGPGEQGFRYLAERPRTSVNQDRTGSTATRTATKAETWRAALNIWETVGEELGRATVDLDPVVVTLDLTAPAPPPSSFVGQWVPARVTVRHLVKVIDPGPRSQADCPPAHCHVQVLGLERATTLPVDLDQVRTNAGERERMRTETADCTTIATKPADS